MTTDSGAAPAAAAGGQAGDAGNAGNAAAAVAADWAAGLNDLDKAYVANKGWKSPVDMVTSYRGIEQQLGGDKVVIPKADDAAGWGQFWDKIGRPKDAAGYDLKGAIPEGAPVSEGFVKAMLPALHGAGLTQAQVTAAVKAYTEYATGATAEAEKAYDQESALALIELEKEWGSQSVRNKEVARRAAAEFGVKPDVLEKWERAAGTKELMKLFHAIGEKLVEPMLIRGETRDFRTLGPAAAKDEIATLMKDREFGAKLASGDASAKERWERLHKLAAG